MSNQLRVLILEDSQPDAHLLLRSLQREGYSIAHQRVDNADDMVSALHNSEWDVILSDYSMPSFSANEGLDLLKKEGLDIPFIIVSGTMGEEAAVEAMKAGAQDYFPKGRTERLAAAIERELREKAERDKRKQAEEELRQAEERFTKAFMVSPIGITITNSQGMFLTINPNFQKLVGREANAIINHTAAELGIWGNGGDERILDISSHGFSAVQNAEVILRSASGEVRTVSMSTERIDFGIDNCVLAMWQDITDRKFAEEKLQKNTEMIQLLQEVTVEANRSTQIEDVFLFAIKRICEETEWPLAHIHSDTIGGQKHLSTSHIWYVSDEQTFDVIRQVTEQYFTVAPQFADEMHEGVISQVYQQKTPVLIDTFVDSMDPIRADALQRTNITGIYAFPIFAQNTVMAIMEFFTYTTDSPDRALLDTIPHIATQLGYVIERTQANNEIQALYNATAYLFNAESIQGLAEQIVHGIVEEFEQVDCGLVLVDDEMGTISRLARAGEYRVDTQTSLKIDGQGLVPRAIRQGELIYSPNVNQDERYIENVPTTASEMVIPLKSRGGTIGALDLQSPHVDFFTASDQRLLSAFSERAAAALEITRLYEELNRYAVQLEQRVQDRTNQLQKAKKRVEAILSNSSDAIILVDVDGYIQQTNTRFIEVYGYGVDELVGQPLAVVISQEAEQELADLLSKVANEREYTRIEAVVRRKNGTTFPVDAAFAAFMENGETEIVCSLRDITEQKRLEDGLREAFEKQKELAELKTRFISTVSHEYRTPLAIIQTSAGLVLKYADRMTAEKQEEHLRKILWNVGHLTNLMDEVLEINRAEKMGIDFRPISTDLVIFVEDLIRDIRQVNPTYQINLGVEGRPVPIPADVRLLRQIVSNLLSNAIKYSKDVDPIDLTLRFNGKTVSIILQDRGVGIPPEDLENLFTLFHRATNVGSIQGTGLGLAIVKRAVDAHNGHVRVESALHKGTTFTVTLPL
ncbi:MAG: hypothetical protein CL607_08105 [Anaerolineaceae bacterium]|nr:hypothetical protein [Anaerolineaceae bacterium]